MLDKLSARGALTIVVLIMLGGFILSGIVEGLL